MGDKLKSRIFDFGKAEIGLGTAIFGISVKNYIGGQIFRPNPCPGDPFRGRLKISVPNIVFPHMRVPSVV